MKKVAILVIVLGVILGGIVLTKKETVVYQNAEPTVVEKEVDALQTEILKAQDSKKSEIEAKAQQAYQEAYDYEMQKVELEVIKASKTRLEERQKELEKATEHY